MMDKLEGMKKRLSELATVLNEFKSETVQLRILELVLNEESLKDGSDQQQDVSHSSKVPVQKIVASKKNTGVPGKRKKAAAGAGAPSTLTQLLSGAFFDKPRTINDVIEHCKHNLARTFKANEFSGKLGRMVRDGDLTRKKNADNQYEYKKP